MRTYFAGCDEIWHAGDIGSLESCGESSKPIKPFRAGIRDIDDWPTRESHLPEPYGLRWRKVEVLMTHIGGYPGKY
jgi:hypothetical protein